jgi:hypothetical protein
MEEVIPDGTSCRVDFDVPPKLNVTNQMCPVLHESGAVGASPLLVLFIRVARALAGLYALDILEVTEITHVCRRCTMFCAKLSKSASTL